MVSRTTTFAAALLLFLLLCVIALDAKMYGQSNRATIRGIISGPNGETVSGAPVQARNIETGTVARAASASDGRYTISDLAAGTYDVSVNASAVGGYNPFSKKNVTIKPGEALRLDIRVEENDSLGTQGDDIATVAAALRKRSVVPNRSVPRIAGKPDLSEVWIANDDLYPEAPAALPHASALAQERIENHAKDHPHTRCLPGSAPVPGASAPFLAKVVQTPSMLVMLFEDVPGFRQVFLDGRKHPANLDPTWLGHSVGSWEGDTLVIDTVGFNDRGWMGLYPRTEKLHIVERYRRPDFGHLEIKVTIEDPGVFAKPWNWNLTWDLAPQVEVLEYVCENNKAENMIGK